MKFLIKNILDFFGKKYIYEKSEKWPIIKKFFEKKLRRMGIGARLGIDEKGDTHSP